jgi:hypothetical protein
LVLVDNPFLVSATPPEPGEIRPAQISNFLCGRIFFIARVQNTIFGADHLKQQAPKIDNYF